MRHTIAARLLLGSSASDVANLRILHRRGRCRAVLLERCTIRSTLCSTTMPPRPGARPARPRCARSCSGSSRVRTLSPRTGTGASSRMWWSAVWPESGCGATRSVRRFSVAVRFSMRPPIPLSASRQASCAVISRPITSRAAAATACAFPWPRVLTARCSPVTKRPTTAPVRRGAAWFCCAPLCWGWPARLGIPPPAGRPS